MKDVKVYTVLVAPLDWGLGHATRCIPIIRIFKQMGCNVIIAGNLVQQALLKLEFPDIPMVNLEGYNIQYASGKLSTRLKLLLQLPKIKRAIKKENTWLNSFLQQQSVDVIISDNRYGLHHPSVLSVLMTHQLNIITNNAFTENIIRKYHYSLIAPFFQCWVPDIQQGDGLAGRLSHPTILPTIPTKYIGILSRMKGYLEQPLSFKFKCCIILSGPEPQRSILEEMILKDIQDIPNEIVFVRGLPTEGNNLLVPKNVLCHNHVSGAELTELIMQSELIICRGGYTSLMELISLKKKLILIPTPAQTEQEYLAKLWYHHGWAYTLNQHHFVLKDAINNAEQFKYAYPDLDLAANDQCLMDAIAGLVKRQ